MATKFTYSYARQNLAQILRDAEESTEPAIITRRGHEDMVLIPASEYRHMMETLHIVSSPRNAILFFQALERSLANQGTPQTIEELKAEVGLK